MWTASYRSASGRRSSGRRCRSGCATCRGRGPATTSSCAPLLAEILAYRRRVGRRQVIDRPLVRVKPGNVAGRKLEIENAQRSSLEHLSMMRLLMNGHDRHLPVATRICRLPCRALASDGDTIRNETEDDESERWRRAHHVGNPSAICCASPQPHGTFDCGLSGADASAELTPSAC